MKLKSPKLFAILAAIPLLALIGGLWRQEQLNSSNERDKVAPQPALVSRDSGKSVDTTAPEAEAPENGQPPKTQAAVRNTPKDGETKVLVSNPAPAVTNPPSGTNSPNAPAPKSPEQQANNGDARNSAGSPLTPADILSQKLDLSDPAKRAEVVQQLKQIEDDRKKLAWERAAKMGLQVQGVRPNGQRFELQYFEGNKPFYHVTKNANAAISTAANLVRGTAPYNVTGSNVTVGIWDGGIPRLTHQEFGSRITVRDGGTTVDDHSNHVTGTVAAAGINPAIKGMASGALIDSYTFGSDLSEMLSAGASATGQAGKLYISNHSYGPYLGWDYDGVGYTWYGKFTDNANPADDIEDDFGKYSSSTASYDGLCYNLPYYLPVFAAGNERNDDPPPSGTNWTESSTGTVRAYNAAQHPTGDGTYKSGYDNVGGEAVAKNLLVVGAVTDAVSAGNRSVGTAALTTFSSAGPTDDGRIKPDVVANGFQLTSTGILSDTDTLVQSGTSMAAPNATGSAALLIDYYGTRFPGKAMRASTLKGLIIHTADDMGTPGPDYLYGWGLMNTKAAADVIKRHADNAGDGGIIEGRLTSSKGTDTYSIKWNGTDPIRATLCWTDPAGTSTTASDDRTRKLVNDLNLKITDPTLVNRFPYVMPYVGDWTNATLTAAATTGINTVDNVEQVYLVSPVSPGVYTLTINYTGSLTNGVQDYSLIISGQSAEPLVLTGGEDYITSGVAGGPFTPSSKTYTLTNSGASSVNWTAASTGNWLTIAPASGTLAPGGNVTVTATPNGNALALSIGTYNANVSFTNTGTGVFKSAFVRLDVGPTEISVEQPAGTPLVDGTSSISYGAMGVGIGSTKTFTIKNLGTASLTGLAISKDGTEASDFTVPALSATSVAPGASMTFNVTFTPGAPGARSAAIHIASNDLDENPFDIALIGTGVNSYTTTGNTTGKPTWNRPNSGSPPTSLSTTTAVPYEIYAFTVGAAGSYTFSSTATPISWDNYSFLYVNGFNALSPIANVLLGNDDFPSVGVSGFTTSLSPGNTYYFVVTGIFNTSFGAHTVLVTGPGVITRVSGPEIAVEQPAGTGLVDASSTSDFGGIITGGSGVKTYTLKNLGGSDLTGIAVTKDGANNSDYTVNTSGMATTVLPGGSTTFAVTFSPSALNTRVAAIHIASNDADENPFDIALTGTGVVPAPTITTPTSASITANSATLGGNVTSDNGLTVTERGVVYSVTATNADPIINGVGVTKAVGTGTTGVFTVAAPGLTQGTGYSFKAYATNSAGTNYTTPVSTFTTSTTPTVTTPTSAGITANSAVLGGNVTSDGGATITERGVVISITTVNADPIINGAGVAKLIGTGTTGVFNVNAAGLTQSTGYSFKAYATNIVGTIYTTPVSTFTTPVAVPLTGTKTVGAGGDYTSLTNTGGLFEAINGNGLNGALLIQITGDLTAETGTVALNALTGTTPSLKIFPVGAVRVVSGSIAGALIRLNGADNVTLDGSLGGTGTDRSLTVTNTSTATPTVLALISLGIGLGATNDVIKNCNISTGVAISIGYGISVGGSTPGTNGADNDNVTIQNNSITAAPIGIFASGTAPGSAGGDDNLSIVGNSIAYNSTLASVGIRVGNALNSSVSQNTVSEQTTASGASTAISIETGFVTSSVTRNTVTKSLTTNTGGWGSRGITVGTGTPTSALTIANNVIYGVNGSNWSSFGGTSSMGITIGTIGNSSTLTTVVGGVTLCFNSVNITGSMGTGSPTAITAAIYIGSGASALDLRNNVFANTQIATNATQKNYAIYSAAANTAFTTVDYNDYFVSNTFNAASAIPGFLTSDRVDLAGVQLGFGQNTHSFTGDPLLTSATDLHVTSLASPVSNTGTPMAGVVIDFDGGTRNAAAPDVGADEFGASTLPTIATPTQTAITATSATLGGDVTGDGGTAITERGVVYSITTANADPIIGGLGVTKITNAGTTGVFTVNATGLTAATGYSFKAYAINNAATIYTGPVSTFSTLTALINWRLTYFGTTGNTGNAADAADPYHTGVPNLAVFALLGAAQNPALVAAGMLPQAQISGGNYVVTFTKPAGVNGVTYGAEWRTDLASGIWTPITDTVSGNTHTFSVPIGSNKNIFIRLRVSTP